LGVFNTSNRNCSVSKKESTVDRVADLAKRFLSDLELRNDLPVVGRCFLEEEEEEERGETGGEERRGVVGAEGGARGAARAGINGLLSIGGWGDGCCCCCC